MKKRLSILMQEEGLTSSMVAEFAGVQPSAISHILSGRNKPGFDFLNNFLLRFPNVNARWLLTGEGAMYADEINVYTVPERGETLTASVETTDVQLPLSEQPNSAAAPLGKPKKEATRTAIHHNADPEIEAVVILYKDGRFKRYG